VLCFLTNLFIKHGPPEHIPSGNGPEFTAKAVRRWLERIGIQTLFIEQATPGRMGTTNPSMENYEMSCSMGRYSILLGRLRLKSKGAGRYRTFSGHIAYWDTARRLLRPYWHFLI
jgi:hypothetical protein